MEEARPSIGGALPNVSYQSRRSRAFHAACLRESCPTQSFSEPRSSQSGSFAFLAEDGQSLHKRTAASFLQESSLKAFPVNPEIGAGIGSLYPDDNSEAESVRLELGIDINARLAR